MENEKKEEVAVVVEEPKMKKEISFKIGVRGALIAAMVIIVLSLGYYYRGAFVAATVDGSPVWRWTVIHESEKQAGKTVLENLILKRIVQDEIAAKDIKIEKKIVDAELAKLEEQYKGAGTSLDALLAEKGVTRAELIETITLQKQVEQLLPKATSVTDEEIASYIETQQVKIPEGQEEQYNEAIKSELTKRKQDEAIKKLVTDLQAKASVKKFVTY